MIFLIGLSLITITLSWWGVGKLIDVLIKQKMFDTVNERSLHTGQVPRGGGLVIVFFMLLGLLAMALLSGRYAMFIGLFVSVLAWSGLSWLDDRSDLTPKLRLATQSGFSVLSILAFGYVDSVQLTSTLLLPLSFFGALLTFIGVLWFANLYNFMDGMDGLAASQSIIGGLSLAIWFWQYGDQSLGFVCLLLASASYGFLLWNWHPAKVFMGDVGSITIGAFFSTLIIIGAGRYQLPVISFVLLFGVFIADASVTILRRLKHGEKIWLPHRSHYYQRLASLNFAHNKITMTLLVFMMICSLIATITVVYRDTIWIGVVLEVVLLALGMAVVVRLESKHQ